MDTRVAVVVDNGSQTCRAGLAGEATPKSVFTSVVGRYKNIQGDAWKEYVIGAEAHTKRDILHLKYPVEYGLITNWNDIEILWHHTFINELKIDPQEHPILLSEPANNPKANREKMIQIMFETFDFSAVFLKAKAVLSLIASGRETGIVVDFGDGLTEIVPIYDSHFLPYATMKSEICGRVLTDYLSKLLNDRGHYLTTYEEIQMVQEIKEKMSYVVFDFEQELRRASTLSYEKTYELPDGKVITVSDECFRCLEPMFKPWLSNMEFPGIHETVFNSIMKCDAEIRTDMFQNIVLSGGFSMCKGLSDRLKREIGNISPPDTKINIITRPETEHLTWTGGSLLASSHRMSKLWIPKEEYEEYGPTIVHSKCF